jgi:hypothetical protein
LRLRATGGNGAKAEVAEGLQPDQESSLVHDRKMEHKSTVLQNIRSAMQQIEPMAAAGWPPAESMLRQLAWCEGFVSGRHSEPRPGPFSMGVISTREFDMYGNQPDLARLINDIQHAVETLLKFA